MMPLSDAYSSPFRQQGRSPYSTSMSLHDNANETRHKRRRVDGPDNPKLETGADIYGQYSVYEEELLNQGYGNLTPSHPLGWNNCDVGSQPVLGCWGNSNDVSVNITGTEGSFTPTNIAEGFDLSNTVSAPSDQVCFGMVCFVRLSVT